MTPFPSSPLDRRLLKAGRLGWAKHLLDSDLFTMAFTPENITQAQAEAELGDASTRANSSKAAEALKRISDRRLSERIVLFFARFGEKPTG